MKRTILGLASILVVCLTVLAVLVVHPIRRVKANHGCWDGMLRGNYEWTEFGSEPNEATPSFWTQTALVNFDGNGNFYGSKIYYVENGAFFGPSSSPPTGTESGTYSVYSDCTVYITYHWPWAGQTYYDNGAVVDANGSEVVAEESSSGADTTGHVDIKKIGDSD